MPVYTRGQRQVVANRRLTNGELSRALHGRQLPGVTVRGPAPIRKAKAKTPTKVAVFDQNGKLVGVCEQSDIQPLATSVAKATLAQRLDANGRPVGSSAESFGQHMLGADRIAEHAVDFDRVTDDMSAVDKERWNGAVLNAATQMTIADPSLNLVTAVNVAKGAAADLLRRDSRAIPNDLLAVAEGIASIQKSRAVKR